LVTTFAEPKETVPFSVCKTIPVIGVNLGTLMYVVPLSVGLVTLSRRYLGMDIPFLGDIAEEAAAETGYNWGEDSAGGSGNGVPTYYGS